MRTLLEVRGLEVTFPSPNGDFKPVAGVDFILEKGRTLGLVGESGCGKTLTALSILRLLPYPGRVSSGSIKFQGTDLLRLPEKKMVGVRGAKIAMIFQEPMTSLNPVFTIGNQVMEAVLAHQRVSRSAARQRAIDLLRAVNIPRPAERMNDYPHQFSGGMRQRVMLAMAISCRPPVLIADEPTTALDVTVQAQIMELLRRLREELGMSLLLVTHDLGLVAQATDRVAVMYLGKVVETCPTPLIFGRPAHPYTRGLLRSVPRLGRRVRRLRTIEGVVPESSLRPRGCAFHPRCELADEYCREVEPRLETVGESHLAACHRARVTGGGRAAGKTEG